MKELIVATTNQGKVKEIQAMLKDLNIEVKSLKDVYDDVPDIVEDGKTFKENALIKAKYVADDLHKIVLADDSGIEIDAFGKLPGIYSARFLGKDTPYPIINQAIIDAIEGKERTCHAAGGPGHRPHQQAEGLRIAGAGHGYPGGQPGPGLPRGRAGVLPGGPDPAGVGGEEPAAADQ